MIRPFHDSTAALQDGAALAACLSKAVRAGLMPVPTGGRYILNPEWYARIHSLDERFQVFEYGLLEFEDEFIVRDWPVVDDADCVLGTEEYQQAAGIVQRHPDHLFGK